MQNENWYVYILRCGDNSLYTGIAKDYERRFQEHLNGVGAKYTKSKKAVKIEKIFICKNRVEASKLEYKIKKINKKYKENLILSKVDFYEETVEIIEKKKL